MRFCMIRILEIWTTSSLSYYMVVRLEKIGVIHISSPVDMLDGQKTSIQLLFTIELGYDLSLPVKGLPLIYWYELTKLQFAWMKQYSRNINHSMNDVR